jgi:RNA polymerase sigma-70 factor (ECF subfamily)
MQEKHINSRDEAFCPSASPGATQARDRARARLTAALVATADQDQRAFRMVYELTCAKLFGICLRICNERAAAQDVLHDVYFTVWQRAGAFDPSRSSPITWLTVIARNRAIDWKRAKGNRFIASLDDAKSVADPRDDPESNACRNRESERLHSSLAALDNREGNAIRSAFFHGLTYQEVATLTNTPLGTVKSSIRRGLTKLRAELDRRQPEWRNALA